MNYFDDDPPPPISDFFPDYYSYSLSIPPLPPDPDTLRLIHSIANINIEHTEMTEEKTQETTTTSSNGRSSSHNRTSPTASTSFPPAAVTSYEGAVKPLIVPDIPEDPHFFHPISNSLLVEFKSANGLPDVKIPRVDAIDEFRVALTEAPGFMNKRDINLKSRMMARTKRDFQTFCLGKPAVRDDYFLVGTDDPTSQDHYLMYISGNTLLGDVRKDPVVSYVRVNEHIRDIKWITSSYILAAVGEGRFSIFTKDETNKLEWSRNINDIHTAHIREVATQPGKPNIVASGGFDRTLCVLDLNRPASVCQQRLQADDVIGSVKWPIWNSQICPSVSLDNGQYIMYDLREKASVAFAYNSNTPNMYTHERYTDHNVLLGYLGTLAGGTIMKHIDMRRGGSDKCVISTEIDPYCDGIGGIEYNYASHSFVTSGFTDFTVWKQSLPRSSSAEESSPIPPSTVKVWSHSESSFNTISNENGYTVSAGWFDHDTVVTASSAGQVGLYIQKFA